MFQIYIFITCYGKSKYCPDCPLPGTLFPRFDGICDPPKSSVFGGFRKAAKKQKGGDENKGADEVVEQPPASVVEKSAGPSDEASKDDKNERDDTSDREDGSVAQDGSDFPKQSQQGENNHQDAIFSRNEESAEGKDDNHRLGNSQEKEEHILCLQLAGAPRVAIPGRTLSWVPSLVHRLRFGKVTTGSRSTSAT